MTVYFPEQTRQFECQTGIQFSAQHRDFLQQRALARPSGCSVRKRLMFLVIFR